MTRLTVAQAIVRFLTAQYSERDGVAHRLLRGLLRHLRPRQRRRSRPGAAGSRATEPACYYQARNEQAMVHAAAGFARMRNRLSTLACTTSVGPGATNMVTGAALATINRLPVLLLPGDVFATRRANPVLQQLEHPAVGSTCRSTTASGRCRASSTGSSGPSSCRRRCSDAMRVLTDPAETGAVTLPAAGRAGRGIRLAGRAVRAAGLARAAAACRSRQLVAEAAGGDPGRRGAR